MERRRPGNVIELAGRSLVDARYDATPIGGAEIEIVGTVSVERGRGEVQEIRIGVDVTVMELGGSIEAIGSVAHWIVRIAE